MPELPEVETIRTGLAASLSRESRICSVQIRRSSLRVPIPRELGRLITGSEVYAVRRRAKFLLFDIGDYTLISHLGMSGSWRFIQASKNSGDENHGRYLKHDHFSLHFADGRELVLNDPRRFGLLDVAPRGLENQNRWLKNLGLEPLDRDFTAQQLRSRAGHRQVMVKNFLMDQKVVVGIGNIYASEILHRAGIRPSRRVNRLSIRQCNDVVVATREVLKSAIREGGTTLRDYRAPDGSNGRFKRALRVYDRAGLPCFNCSAPIQSRVMAGRATYWCRVCQK